MSRPHRVLRRSAVGAALLLAGVMVAPGPASAGILAVADAGASVTTARWSSIPAAVGATSLTTSFQTGYGEKSAKFAIVDIYNNGTVAVSGFTLTGTRSGPGSGTLQSCASGWVEPAKAKDAPTCDGSDSGAAVGTLQPGRGLAIASSIPPGGRVSLRIQSSNTTWTLSVAVTA